ncbi:hypothetical protein CC80DRAFT_482938 [Byssothecium circinans]|uniref:HNH domain-containing protein n=1 Tax=Byssothecium circinans TaxID=147558 RepID=A0A6A5TEP0_9PLEO|nr:hypothetical protein CC80DRAFT_482938 [Byssothecium circinans]
MATLIPDDEQSNYETFRDCLSEPVIRALAAPTVEKRGKSRKKRERKGVSVDKGREMVVERSADAVDAVGDGEGLDELGGSAAEDLGDFIEYLTTIIFPSLPPALRTLTHSLFRDSPRLQETYTPPLSPQTSTSLLNTIPPTAIDSLESYGLLHPSSDTTDQYNFFTPILSSYITAATAPPPIWSATRTTECELCGRSWIPLTYHHLIPKSTHERVLKRKWHNQDLLNSVAWLCRACHSFVHRLSSNEGLAKHFYNMHLIREGGSDGERRAEVEGWVKWVAGVRWRSR